MKKTIGQIMGAGGLIGVIYFGYMYFQDSESFEAFGADVAVSTGDYVPALISAVVMLAGVLIARSK
ncbi:MAG: hypothetical protein ABJK11_01900 [Balneola sp.]